MKRIILYLSVALFLFSCKKRDITKPELQILSPSDSAVVLAGSNLELHILAKDNQALSQVKIDIHNAFNGHGHEKILYTPFSMIKVENLSGTEASPTLSISIPDTAAAGPYHLTMQVVDEAANLSDLVMFPFRIKNPDDTIAPVLIISSPLSGSTFPLNSTLQVQGQASDDLGLLKLEYTLRRVGSDNNLAQSEFNYSTASESFQFDISLSGAAIVKGNYELDIVLYDTVYNTDIKTIVFTIN